MIKMADCVFKVSLVCLFNVLLLFNNKKNAAVERRLLQLQWLPMDRFGVAEWNDFSSDFILADSLKFEWNKDAR